jgi:hypothetical protein
LRIFGDDPSLRKLCADITSEYLADSGDSCGHIDKMSKGGDCLGDSQSNGGLGRDTQQQSRSEDPEWVVTVSQKADLLNFAEWAFSSEGFPELLILAYGDFSDRRSRVLFCRKSSILGTGDRSLLADEPQTDRCFRIMSRKDEYLLGSIEGCLELLNACPPDRLWVGAYT